ncbi:hypothetical protein [Pseudomonas sp. EA_35y_Pfl2_R111]|uniref:hypothetical protein n=1 Tax=Pseudomonas sp. EA_35y_Pfl2_R111 TaxID=3088689 RepID=UPI0030D9B975
MARLNKKRRVKAGKTVAEQRASLLSRHSGNLKTPRKSSAAAQGTRKTGRAF